MSSRYRNTKLKPAEVGAQTPTLIYKTVKYPEIPLNVNDIYVYTTEGDRLDLLAEQFYSDINLYWIISSANPDKISFSSLFLSPGTELRIPTDLGSILFEYNKLNSF